MIDFKEVWINPYSNLLSNEKKNSYEIIFKNDKNDIKFVSRYSTEIIKIDNHTDEEDIVELEVVEWE